ncbi:ATP-dependent Clp protease ATP-binding subunit ClpX-like isoform X2 [Drosophila rhopaloa]|uniref:ATP-dependent Clp protease ATP-binding subunit ClpX-like isoform X2 n=1 Tax=Drosophila rhopaloa TaxID=1041015 RepID=A0A6P4EHN5_DRORH|nr:ATP-dependent Clp protease ATP-binding subunit ClpX-like isoform X2 [Drosophila rhopaloa]
MSVCLNFVNGNCKYGESCYKEHVDLKRVLKEDIESSINGRVWPFSAYGPFYLKGNFPNFIEDDSFEEVRLRYYKAKRMNLVEVYYRQFCRDWMVAKNKLHSLLQMSSQTVSTMIDLYQQPSKYGNPCCARNSMSGSIRAPAFKESNQAQPEKNHPLCSCGQKQNLQTTGICFGQDTGQTKNNWNDSVGNTLTPQPFGNSNLSEEESPTKAEEKKWGKHPPAPQKIMEYLDKHVVGQHLSKKVLAVAVYNHYKRIHNNLPQQKPQYSSDNVDQDVTPRLDQLQISGNCFALTSSPEKEIPTDVGLGKETTISESNSELDRESEDVNLEKSNIIMLGPTGSGKTLIAKTIAKCLDVPFAICDCTTLTPAGYVGEDIESALLTLLRAAGNNVERAQTGIVYLDEVDKICALPQSKQRCDIGGRGVQQGMLKMLEGSLVNLSGRKLLYGNKVQLDTTNILFVASGAFTGLNKIIAHRLNEKGSDLASTSESGSPLMDQDDRDRYLTKVQTCDLVEFGMIPEFIGRFPVVVPFHSFDVSMLVRILTEPRSALITQYKALLDMDDVNLTFTEEAVEAIAQLAMERDTGARGLRSIMEQLLLDPMFLVPGSDIRRVHITADCVKGKSAPEYSRDTNSSDSGMNLINL